MRDRAFARPLVSTGTHRAHDRFCAARPPPPSAPILHRDRSRTAAALGARKSGGDASGVYFVRLDTFRLWSPHAARLTAAGLLLGLLALPNGRAGEHPALLLSVTDVPRLKHVCGLPAPASADPRWGRSGVRAADFQALRAGLVARGGDDVLPGELLAAAFLHVVADDDPTDRVRVRLIESALREPAGAATDPLELAIALDWCWDALSPTVRHEFLIELRRRAAPLAPSDSPLETRRFREKLAAVAVAAAIDPADEPSQSWVELRTRLLDAARDYFAVTFPQYVAWRGRSPTGSARAADEEADTALAIEIASRLLQRDAWPDYRASVGRWLEHYLFEQLDHPALRHGFLHDDGDAAPLTPAPAWRDLLPVTAHLIAARTRDPAAALLADRIESALAEPDPSGLTTLWRWVAIAFDTTGIPRCDPRQLPTARNLDGAVLFRGPAGSDATVVWIDAGQPFLRRRQHFDAGHFLLCRSGELVVSGANDVLLEAIASKGGAQYLGQQNTPFDFEQYCTATISHNALVLWDPARVVNWYGQRYLPSGGQRCIEHTCTDFALPLESQGRLTGRQLAYGWHDTAAYLALDLAPAYDRRAVSAYTRTFCFVWGRVLVVVDRVTTPKGRTPPTWILNLPARPTVDGTDLPASTRVAGSTNDAGVWRCDTAAWLRWTDRDGSLWFTAPLPTTKAQRIVGGPARRLRIAEGRHVDRTYIGGDADGFERLIIPAERRGAENAWYRLGRPTLLGAQFGQQPLWGRIELEPLERGATTIFVAVLIPDRADATVTPAVSVETGENPLVLHLSAGRDQATLRLPSDAGAGGRLEIGGPLPSAWDLPTDVQPDMPLAAD